jgi:hypothetical protein
VGPGVARIDAVGEAVGEAVTDGELLGETDGEEVGVDAGDGPEDWVPSPGHVCESRMPLSEIFIVA